MEVFVARHPVFDRQKEVYAYELDFRAGFQEYYQALEADTSSTDLMAFVNFAELTDGKSGFISFPRNLLMVDFPVLFASESMITGISAEVAEDEEVLDRCRNLKEFGYAIAIDGFTPAHADAPLLELAAYVSVDFVDTPPAQREAVPGALSGREILALARNVETAADFDQAVSWGYSLFHGEFFTKPVVQPGKEIAASKLTYLQLLREVNNPALSYDEIAALVEQDVALTYKLLRFMNSAWFGLKFEVSSVKHALVLLGPKEIRRWVSMVAVRSASDDKPQELLVRSLTRAKAAEQVGLAAKMQKAASELFLMGMLSLMDALTDKDMEEVLSKLPLKEDIKAALLGGTGAYGHVYDAVLSYEKGNWDGLAAAAAGLKIDEQIIPELIRKSVTWARNALKEM